MKTEFKIAIFLILIFPQKTEIMIYDKKSSSNGNIENLGIHEKIIDALPIPIFYRDVNLVCILLSIPVQNIKIF